MITISITTYNRLTKLSQCLESIDSNQVNEILIFNDDEKNILTKDQIPLNTSILDYVHIYQPSDFGFYDRKFSVDIFEQVLKVVKIQKV